MHVYPILVRAVCNRCPPTLHTCMCCISSTSLRDVIHGGEKKEHDWQTEGDTQKDGREFNKNRGAAIQMDNTTSNKKQQQWQLHLPAAVFHMLMLVLLPAKATQNTKCVSLCVHSKWSDVLSIRCHVVLLIRVIRQGLWTQAHLYTEYCVQTSLVWCFYITSNATLYGAWYVLGFQLKYTVKDSCYGKWHFS